jgi:hypothetical protein
MKPTEYIDRLELLRALIEPVANSTTDRIIRELVRFFEVNDDDRESMVERTQKTPAGK